MQHFHIDIKSGKNEAIRKNDGLLRYCRWRDFLFSVSLFCCL